MRLFTTVTLFTICLTATGTFLNYACTAQSRAIIESLHKGDSSRTVFFLPANTRLSQVAWRDSIYRFASFEPARVTFATGFSPTEQVRMNYNLYFLQMDYISSQGDTLQVTPSKEMKLLSLSDHIFYYHSKVGYIEVIQQLPVALGVRNMLVAHYIDYPAGGRYEQVGDNPFDDEDVRGAATTLDRYYMKGGDYFFIGTNNAVYKASETSIFKLFREHKQAVKKYLDEHKVDFGRKEDLMKLLVFCNGLKE